MPPRRRPLPVTNEMPSPEAIRSALALVNLDQQRERWRADPVAWVNERLKEEIWSKQCEILHAVSEHKLVAVQASHGVGKSFVLSRLIAYYVDNYDPGDFFIVTTAPSWAQVKTVIWRYIGQMLDVHDLPGTITQNCQWKVGQELVAIGRKPADRAEQSFQGIHARKGIIGVIDEASGVDDQIWNALDSMATTHQSRIVAIGNPDAVSSRFHKVCTGQEPNWHRIKLGSFDAPWFTGEKVSAAMAEGLVDETYVLDKKDRWGEDSALYRIKVLGEFADLDESAVIPMPWIQAAFKRWERWHDAPDDVEERAPLEGRVVLGVDVGHLGCFDDQTEILTDEGWKFFADVKGSERVLSLDGDVAEWAPITGVHAYPFSGELNYYKGRTGDFAVTDNHNMLTRPPVSDIWRIKRFDQISRYSCLRRPSRWGGISRRDIAFTESSLMPKGGRRRRQWRYDWLDWCELVGWFVSEGNVQRYSGPGTRINISQNPGWKADELEALFERMGIRWTYNGHTYMFKCLPIARWLEKHCGVGAANKRIPRVIRNSSPEGIERFLIGYRLGDGTRNKNGTAIYGTTSRKLADDLQEVLVKVGRAGRVAQKRRAGTVTYFGDRKMVRKHDEWIVNEWKRGQDLYLDKNKVERRHYDGTVYCVSTPHRTIMTRRNGCVLWTGNSDKTVIVTRQGATVINIESWSRRDTVAVAGLVRDRLARYPRSIAVVDAIGVGAGVVDQLRNQRQSVLPFVSSAATHRRDITGSQRFNNSRSAAYWSLRELLHPDTGARLAIQPNDDLLRDLSAPRFEAIPGGRLKIEIKADIKKRLGHSPDLADALVYAFWIEQVERTEGRPGLRNSTVPYTGGGWSSVYDRNNVALPTRANAAHPRITPRRVAGQKNSPVTSKSLFNGHF